MNDETTPVRRHILIAGTGRAGTSFLVRYLTELGLDTHLARHPESAMWDENANAGLEEGPFVDLQSDLPYVIKSPWVYEYIDDLLSSPSFTLDAIIIPVRDLTEAAASRCIVERRAMYQSSAWMSKLESNWEQWGHVPGGIVYSLNPVDQGRLLAVGFHHLVQRSVAADIPTVLLAFPRLVADADYLFTKLRAVLPPAINCEAARAAHERVADRAKVRIRPEIDELAMPGQQGAAKIMSHVSHAAMDRIALRRELGRLRKELADANECAARSADKLRLQEAKAAEDDCRRKQAFGRVQAALEDAMETAKEAARLREQLAHSNQRIMDLESRADRCAAVQKAYETGEQRIAELLDEIARIRVSRSWRLTRPYRAAGAVVKRLIASSGAARFEAP